MKTPHLNFLISGKDTNLSSALSLTEAVVKKLWKPKKLEDVAKGFPQDRKKSATLVKWFCNYHTSYSLH